MLRFRSGLLAALALPILAAPAAAQGHYHVLKSLSIGQAGADYIIIDPTNRRLYGLGDKVIDVDKDTVIGNVVGGGGGYVIAVPENRGMVRNGTIFDLKTLAVTGKIDGMRADGSRYDPVTHRGFGWSGANAWVVDMKTGTLITKGTIGDGLESGAADGKGKMYFAVEAAGSLEKLDAATLKIEGTYPATGCGTAQGLTMDTQSRRVFMACDKEEIVMNADDGSIVARVPVPSRADMNCFDQTTKLLFNPNRADSTLSVIHEDSPNTYSVVEKVPMGGGARTCAVDEVTHKVYVFYSQGPRGSAQLIMVVLGR